MQTKFLSSRPFTAVWLVILVAYVLAGTADAPFHGDEATQIYMSRDYAYQFIDHDYATLAYTPTPANAAEQDLRLLNGTINKYLIGLAWHINGLGVHDINEQWDWGANWDYNQQNGHAPSPALLQAARWPSAILLAAGVVVIFAIGRSLGGRWTPYAASLYYALNPALLLNGRRAMMEGGFIFFSLLVVLAGIWLLQKPSLRRSILFGLVSGFALASKHTALFPVGAVFAAILLHLIYQSVRSEDDYSVVDYVQLPYLAIAGVIAFGSFIALNPAWWGDPLARAELVLKLRTELLAGQTAAFGGYADFGDQLTGFLRQSFIVTPQYFEVNAWQGYLSDQIIRYEASGWRGVSVGGSFAGAVVLCGMMAAGLWELVRPILCAPSAELPEAQAPLMQGGVRWLVALWGLVTLISTLFLTPLEWQRYYLPVYPVIGLLAALGISRIIEVGKGLVVRRTHDPDETILKGDDSRPDTLPELV